MLQGPPEGVCQAAQIRRCGAAVDSPVAVAALSKNPQKIEKMAKNGHTEPRVIALERVKVSKGGQKGVKKGSKMIQKMGLNQARR